MSRRDTDPSARHDGDFMREAIRLSVRAVRGGHGGPFGAVVVKDARIVGSGYNRVTSQNDPTAHAEITAIRRACQRLGSFSLVGCDLYASCEPCPMCLAAIYWARIRRVYFAATRKDASAAGFDDALFYREMTSRGRKKKGLLHPMPGTDALRAFDLWNHKKDRIHY
jgi:guanine deaminase